MRDFLVGVEAGGILGVLGGMRLGQGLLRGVAVGSWARSGRGQHVRFEGTPWGQNLRHESAVRGHQALMQVLECTFTGASGPV